MRRSRFSKFCGFVVLLSLGLGTFAFAQVSADVKATADQLAASIYVGPSMATLRELSDGFGGRLSGSPAHNRAVEWAATKFRSYGIQNVKLEPFTMPNGWVRGTAHGEILAPMTRALHVESMGWAPSTPPGGIKGEVVLIDDITADGIKAKADKIKGKIVMLDAAKIFADGWVKVFKDLAASQQLFKDAGALALLNPDWARNNVINAFSFDWGGHESPLPEAHVGMEDSETDSPGAGKRPGHDSI